MEIRDWRLMKRWGVGWLVWGLAVTALLLLAGSLVLVTLNRSYPLPGKGPWVGQVAWLLSLASAPVVGGLIAHKQPGNAYGWVWLLYGFWRGGVQSFTESYSIYGLLVAPGSLPLAECGVPLAVISWLLGIAMLPFNLLLFPTGRLPSPRWRVVTWVTGVALVVGLLVCSVVPGELPFVPVENPFGAAGFAGQAAFVLFDVSLLTIFLMILLSAIAPLGRWRRATGIERQQLKWFAYAAVLLLVSQIHQLPAGGNLPEPWDSFEEAASFALLPVAIGIAVLRYRLWDIDVIIRRTLLYSVLTATLALVYFGGVVSLQGLFTAVGGEQSAVAIVLSTLAIAALFSPLRGRLQDVIDRRFYRRKYDAAQTLAAFAATARDEVEMERLAAGLVHVIEDTMQPAAVSLWLKSTAADPSSLRGLRVDSGPSSGQAQRTKDRRLNKLDIFSPPRRKGREASPLFSLRSSRLCGSFVQVNKSSLLSSLTMLDLTPENLSKKMFVKAFSILTVFFPIAPIDEAILGQ